MERCSRTEMCKPEMLVTVYWEPECERYLEAAQFWIRDTFSGILVKHGASVALYNAHYDWSRFQYDAVEILEAFPHKTGFLYMVHHDLYHPGYRYLYGAALPGKAVVSDFRPDTDEGFFKEICHEIGHSFGLGHCSSDCVMRPSHSETELKRKSTRLCRSCGKKWRNMLNIQRRDYGTDVT